MQMKNIEVLVLGGPLSGKSSLVDRLAGNDTVLNSLDSGSGMRLVKTEVDTPSGEPVRVSFWDPKVSATVSRETPEAKPSGLSQLIRGDLFQYQSSSEEDDDLSSN